MGGQPLVFTPGGSLTQTVAVDTLADSDNSEGSEIFRLRLLSADNAQLEHGDDTYGTGTIHDPPACIDPDIAWHPASTLSVDESSLTITEGDSAPSTVRLSTPFCERQDGSLTYAVNHVSTDRNDFPETQDMSVDRALEPGSTTDNYAFDTFDDERVEDDEDFVIRVNWSRRMCIQNEQYCSRPDQETTVTIYDNDVAAPLPALRAGDVVVARDAGRRRTHTEVRVHLSDSLGRHVPARNLVTMRYRTRDVTAVGGTLRCLPGIDYLATTGEVVFNVGDTYQFIPITVCPTPERYPTKQFQVVLFPDDSSGGAPLGDSIGTVLLEGWAEVSIDDSGLLPSESSGSVRLWLRVRDFYRSGSVDWGATEACTPELGLCVPATAGLDYVSASGTIDFNYPDVSEVPIDIALMGDNVNELAEAFSVRLSNDVGDIIINPAAAVGTVWIVDDDPTPTLDFETTGLSVPEGTAFTFTVELDGTSDRPVTVDWATESGDASTATEDVDYSSTGGTLTFSPGQTTASFTVTSLNDAEPESDETFRVQLSNPRNALLARPESFATATIIDDDSSDG